MRPASERDLIPLGPIAWCWSLEKKRSEEGEVKKKGGKEREKWQLDLRMCPFPSSSCKIGGSNWLFFPPAGLSHACMLLSNSQISGNKTKHYLDYQMLEEM